MWVIAITHNWQPDVCIWQKVPFIYWGFGLFPCIWYSPPWMPTQETSTLWHSGSDLSVDMSLPLQFWDVSRNRWWYIAKCSSWLWCSPRYRVGAIIIFVVYQWSPWTSFIRHSHMTFCQWLICLLRDWLLWGPGHPSAWFGCTHPLGSHLRYALQPGKVYHPLHQLI